MYNRPRRLFGRIWQQKRTIICIPRRHIKCFRLFLHMIFMLIQQRTHVLGFPCRFQTMTLSQTPRRKIITSYRFFRRIIQLPFAVIAEFRSRQFHPESKRKYLSRVLYIQLHSTENL